MPTYRYDVKFFRTATVVAANEAEAKRLVFQEDDRIEWGELDQDGEPELLEIDGEMQ
jgi:hypothetical protein